MNSTMFWDCPACNALNSAGLEACATCGHARKKKREKRAKIAQETGFEGSNLERAFNDAWLASYPAIPFVRELYFDTNAEAHKRGESRRMWRFDFAFVAQRVAVEIEGGVFQQGKSGHTTGQGYTENCNKYNSATLAGWRVLRFTSAHLKPSTIQQTIELVKLALGD